MNAHATLPPTRTTPGLLVRYLIGGLLMGIANVVPGISGGAMLLIVGIYTRFIAAVAELPRFHFRLPSFLLLFTVALGAGLAILFSADTIAYLVVTYPLITYSIFLGMRLGAIPMVWRLARPATAHVWIGCALGLILTIALATFQYRDGVTAGGTHSSPLLLFLAGLVGASATLLPGMDGSYFLLLMGQYVPILTAVGDFRSALAAGDFSAARTHFLTLLPVALGVLLGIGGIGTLLKFLLSRFPKLTFGVLLGIVIGAGAGLYPFRESVPPQPGDSVKGVLVTTDNLAELSRPEHRKDWPLRFHAPSPSQLAASLALIAAGFFAARLLSKLEPRETTA